MAFKKQVASPVAEVQPFIQGVAKNLVERLYGPQGPAWGTLFSDIEELAVQIGQVLSQQMIHQSLQRQACEPPPEAEQVCPTCGGPLVAAEPEPRLVTTRAGDAQWLEPATHCPRCRRDFFPQSKRLGIDRGHHSPAVIQRVIYAGTHHPSFEQASNALRQLADLSIPTKQVERLTRRIGEERCAERDAATHGYLDRPLTERKAVPAGVAAPDLAVVQMDGGRLQILNRGVAADPACEGTASTGHWREDKVGLLASMSSEVRVVDPCPEIPACFVDPRRMLKLTQEIKGSAGVSAAEIPAASPPANATTTAADSNPDPSYLAPKLEQRRVVATRVEVKEFGGLLATAAWEQGFYGATRRAFVADGSNANWGVWERHFSSFTPILDFIHALTYVFAASMAGRPFAVGWAAYTAWIQQVWSGEVAAVIAALTQRQAELGEPREGEAAPSPRVVVTEALEYLRNQQGRMQYAAYRRAGLPLTSSHIESTVKQINQRVKGSEKFWSESGAEAILQLRADVLSETEPLTAFWHRRQATATGQRRYSSAT